MGTLVMKFGGSSIGTTAALTQVLSIVLHEAKQWDRLVLVASALDGVTDMLIEAAHLAQLNNTRGYRRIAATIRTRHMALIDKLPFETDERQSLQAEIDRLLFDMLTLYQNIADQTPDNLPAEKLDSVVGTGEKMSARIIAALIRQNGLRSVAIDTGEIIITDDVFGNATPDLTQTRARIQANLIPMLERDIIPVLTGYIGGTSEGRQTTLGRGGSDYTASTLAQCLNADEVWVWTDVDGIMTGDPQYIPSARPIAELSYDEMAEMAFFGAKVLHPRMVAPLKKHNIPLRIKNVYKPQQAGTRVHALPADHQPVKAVTRIQGISLSSASSGPISAITALVDEVMFQTTGARADVTISAQGANSSLLCFVIPTSAGPDVSRIVQNHLQARLAEIASHPRPAITGTWQVQPVSIITAIGAQFNGSPALMIEVLRALQSVRVLAISQNPTWCGLSLVVAPAEADSALRIVHQLTEPGRGADQ